MKKTFLLILLILFIFFLSGRAVSIIITDKYKGLSKVSEEDFTGKVEPIHELALLGKKLFFDPVLSRDGTVSCATCHKSEHAFSDDKAVSIGIGGQKGERNTPTIFNTGTLKFLFWDGRAKSLEEQALGPITNPKEMGETIEGVLKKLNSSDSYVNGFKVAFGQSPITASQLASAISEFERTLISKDSNYDRYLSGDEKALSKSAKNGLELFHMKAMCTSCHKGLDFTDGDFHNIGLPITNDVGRAAITQSSKDTRKFKTPTLREITNTAPYFHSGQFETLEQVITFYNAGGGEDTLKDSLKKPLDLTEEEQKDLVEFLKSLSGRQKFN